ncbi:hypothetical protein OPIT5_22440 [Opitutaceae bacterium TAV5]|nr:hypothetical protein OPIT5_22440 [Opitutaceae bacterium TAV5]
MNLLFLCGSLEPGRDGVGDYTRRLAGACAARGHDCAVLALNDPHIDRATDEPMDNIRLLRLPSAQPWPDRLADAIRYRQILTPDWVSWQFVAQGLHPRGFLPAALLRAAPGLRGPRCHVMLHELWLGLEAGAGLKARALGWLQRRGMVCLLEQLDPDCLHTSNPSCQHALRREGFEAGMLGIFGNVPFAEGSAAPETTSLTAVTFGTLHPQWRPAETVAWMLATARRLDRRPVLVAIGRTGRRAAAILDVFRQHGIGVTETGEVEPRAVSRLLAAADFGIAPHPWALIGKSGAAAAMLEHGLPVLVPRDDWRLRDAPPLPSGPADPLLVRLTGIHSADTDLWLAARRRPESALPRTATAFLQALELAFTSP